MDNEHVELNKDDIIKLINIVKEHRNTPVKIVGFREQIECLNKISPIDWIDEEGIYPRHGRWDGYLVVEFELVDFEENDNIYVIGEGDTLY